MPLTPIGIAGLCSQQWLSTIPTAVAAIRSSKPPLPLIPPHNPGLEMMKACASGWTNTLLATILTDAYVGTSGPASTPAPMPPIFTAAIPGLAIAMCGTLVWAGPTSVVVANLLLGAPVVHTLTQCLVTFNPLPGAGLGTGTLNKATCPAILRVTTTPLFIAALTAAFTATGKFNLLDVPGGPLTPQIIKLIAGVSKYYAIILESLVLQIVYPGATGPSPFSFANAGKFL